MRTATARADYHCLSKTGASAGKAACVNANALMAKPSLKYMRTRSSLRGTVRGIQTNSLRPALPPG
jgi:hypothetical protein